MYNLYYALKKITRRPQLNINKTKVKKKKLTLQAKQLLIDNKERMEVLTVFPVGSSV